MSVTHIRVEPSVHERFKAECDNANLKMKGVVSDLILQWLEARKAESKTAA